MTTEKQDLLITLLIVVDHIHSSSYRTIIHLDQNVPFIRAFSNYSNICNKTFLTVFSLSVIFVLGSVFLPPVIFLTAPIRYHMRECGLESIILKLETWRRTLCLKVIDVKGLRSYFSQMFPNICGTYLEAASTAASSSLNLVFFLTSLMKLTRPSLSSCPFRKQSFVCNISSAKKEKERNFHI